MTYTIRDVIAMLTALLVGANSQPVQPRAASSAKPVASVLSATSHPFVPASLPPRLRKQGIPTTPPGVYSEVATTVTIPTVEVTALSTPSDFGKREDPPFGSRWRGGFAKYDRSETESSLPTIPLPVERTTQHDHDLESIGYVNSKTGYSLTKRELQAYERGVIEQVMNNDGSLGQVKVYFKPNFIDDNPWEDLEIAAGLRAKK